MTELSILRPVDPASLPDFEKEQEAPWIVRKLVGSMTGRIVMSSYESLRAAGTNVICLSAWGDSSPLFLPCIRFRDVVVHTAIAATGGVAAIATPAAGPVFDAVVDTVGDSIAVELAFVAGFDVGVKLSNDLIFDKPLKAIIPVYSSRLETTHVKTLLITLKYKHTMSDASLGYFRASVHKGDASASMFSSIQDYLAVEKGWWNPTLFASSRRPCIPRSIQADVIFCHGPFLQGDYRVAQTLLQESALIISLAPEPPASPSRSPSPAPAPDGQESARPSLKHALSEKSTGLFHKGQDAFHSFLHHKTSLKSIPLDPTTNDEKNVNLVHPISSEAETESPPLRRMVILTVGISPHRAGLWTSSARPGESVINYHLLNGCPALVVPVQPGAPLIAWDTLTLEELHKVSLGSGEDQGTSEEFEGIVTVLFEYVGMCVDWARCVVPSEGEESDVLSDGIEKAKKAVKDGLALVVASAIRSKDSEEVKKKIDLDRAGIVMLRLP